MIQHTLHAPLQVHTELHALFALMVAQVLQAEHEDAIHQVSCFAKNTLFTIMYLSPDRCFRKSMENYSCIHLQSGFIKKQVCKG